MARRTDIFIGERFGRLTAVSEAKSFVENNGKTRRAWICKCDCGGVIVKLQFILRRKDDHGCKKCLSVRKSEINTIHGNSGIRHTKLFGIWKGMRSRCFNSRVPSYKYYGGKGIGICPNWAEFLSFKKWAVNNGYTEGLSIDRMNPSGDYSPENCEWVTKSENSRRIKHPKVNQESVAA